MGNPTWNEERYKEKRGSCERIPGNVWVLGQVRSAMIGTAK